MKDAKQLKVWQEGIDLCHDVYKTTGGFPRSELCRLSGQMRRAAVAVASTLAEGGRETRSDYRRFVIIARGSAAELETQIVFAHKLGLLAASDREALLGAVREIIRMLSGLVRSLPREGGG